MHYVKIKMSEEFDIDLGVAFLNFDTSSRSITLVNMITLECYVLCCTFTAVLFIRSTLTFVSPL